MQTEIEEKIDDIEVCLDDGCGTYTSVFNGFFSNQTLKNLADELPWRYTEEKGEYGEPYSILTLKEISDALPYCRTFTVVVNGPRKAKIYQYGNHTDCGWEYLGEILGYM
ncbi:MAG: hypothetical protein K6E64_05110 [Lachnospiraceae bacterium]|nr:hypothetical protein [Lachnospiraceae bacterium]